MKDDHKRIVWVLTLGVASIPVFLVCTLALLAVLINVASWFWGDESLAPLWYQALLSWGPPITSFPLTVLLITRVRKPDAKKKDRIEEEKLIRGFHKWFLILLELSPAIFGFSLPCVNTYPIWVGVVLSILLAFAIVSSYKLYRHAPGRNLRTVSLGFFVIWAVIPGLGLIFGLIVHMIKGMCRWI